jgi:hypothetical protein
VTCSLLRTQVIATSLRVTDSSHAPFEVRERCEDLSHRGVHLDTFIREGGNEST